MNNLRIFSAYITSFIIVDAAVILFMVILNQWFIHQLFIMSWITIALVVIINPVIVWKYSSRIEKKLFRGWFYRE